MATNTQAINHILQRIVPFENDVFPTTQIYLREGCSSTLSSYFQVLHLDALRSLGEKEVSIALMLNGHGRCRLTFYRQSSESSFAQPLMSISLTLLNDSEVRIDLGPDTLSGIAYLEIEALSDLKIFGASWALKREPQQIFAAKLSVVSCTFNRPREMHKTIKAVRSSSTFQSGNARLIIVDNANNLSVPSDLVDDRIKLISQSNFGGAGGFTRGLLESKKLGDATHILLMDDDVDVVPEVIDRVWKWLSILPHNVVLSGAMLDGVDKTILYEAGGRFHPHTFYVAPDINGIPLDSEEAIRKLAQTSSPDYGAWWFLAFSQAALEKVGLPLPVFIRGDDIEFGIRLKKHGFPTQVVHGLAVWHEPFYLKQSEWQMYYAIRNFTLINSLHFSTSTVTYLRLVTKTFLQFALRYDYGSAAAIERGLSHFLNGPAFLLSLDETSHRETVGYVATHSAESLTPSEAAKIRTDRLIRPTVSNKVSHLLSISRHLLPARTKHPPQVFLEESISWRWIQRDQYLKLHPSTKAGRIYRKRPLLFWRLVVRMMFTFIKTAFTFHRRSAQYRRALPCLTSENTWKTYLDWNSRKVGS